MHEILDVIVRLAAPVVAFTSEEVWEHLTQRKGASVHRQTFREAGLPPGWSAEEESRWERLFGLRTKVNEALEKERQAKKIGKSLEAGVVVEGGKAKVEDATLLQEICLVSHLEIRPGSGEATVQIVPARGTRCVRCWKHEESVGKSADHPELCERCTDVVKGVRA
jgi:isoleucyl-tRNA synthetase